jgi:hypothetical protein
MEQFKENINLYVKEMNNTDLPPPKEMVELINYVNDNTHLIDEIIEPLDPHRCIACCYNKKQCTKKKKKESQFCGIHIKGTPYSVMRKTDNIIKIDISLTNIKGIMCYVDKNNNVYKAEDIIQRKLTPTIIATWDGLIYIPI